MTKIKKKYLNEALKENGLRLYGSYYIDSYQECSELIDFLFNKKSPPNAIVCYNDQTANVLLNALAIKGYKVPQDVAVIGIDGLDDPFQVIPLTSVKLPFDEMGKACCNIIDNVLVKNSIQTHFCTVEPQLIIRNST